MRIEKFITYKQPHEATDAIIYRTQFVSDHQHFVISERITISVNSKEAHIFRCIETGYISDYESLIVSCKDTEQCIREFILWNAFIS